MSETTPTDLYNAANQLCNLMDQWAVTHSKKFAGKPCCDAHAELGKVSQAYKEVGKARSIFKEIADRK